MQTYNIVKESPAIKALGFLFKLTEVYLWDDGSVETREVPLSKYKKFPDSDENDNDPIISSSNNDVGASLEDNELEREMNALGLPLCFQTTKRTEQMRSKMKKGKSKDPHMKHSHQDGETVDKLLEVSEMSGQEIVLPLPSVLHDDNNSSSSFMSMPLEMDVKEQLCNATHDVQSNANGISESISTNLGTILSPECYEVVDQANTVSYSSLMECESPEDLLGVHNDIKGDQQPCFSASAEYCQSSGALDDFLGECPEQQPCFSASAEYCQSSGALDDFLGECPEPDGDFGDWQVCWDFTYTRNYFYNGKTNVSTWFPPSGMEHLGFKEISQESNYVNSRDTAMKVNVAFPCDMQNSEELLENNDKLDSQPLEEQLFVTEPTCGSVTVSFAEEVSACSDTHVKIADPDNGDLDCQFDSAIELQENKSRRTRVRRKSSKDNEEHQYQGISKEYAASIGKYWCQRYLLFSRFDDGIRMDEEGWFSVTPELVARHHAIRCGSGTIIDCFTGVGGNAIQFALRSKHVIAIDIDGKKIDYAFHNAATYGVDDRIDFVRGDFFLLAPMLKADTCFLSPPWGGPDYAKVKIYDLKTMLKPRDGYFLFKTAKSIARRIVMFLPRNVDFNQLAELALSSSPPWSLEVEKNYLNGKLKAITAYFDEPPSADLASCKSCVV